ncbi:hypothetical protein [Thermogemmatispora onikobensis]|uniref:hypothetical protein n=1 Tax=Thermogemmatispora onikobensis TaxID=732234 RepID=UPI000853E8C5|nr:hypothetical protein [Thermogemmatispora onikobensis]
MIYRGHPVLSSCGDFVDDYAVNPHERDDLSLDACSSVRQSGVIWAFQAWHPHGSGREEIVTTALCLCTLLGTAAHWPEQEGCLEIEVGEA